MFLLRLALLSTAALFCVHGYSFNDANTSSNWAEEDRIYGGSEADVSTAPYTVSLIDGKGEIRCGASLVAPQYIVTAAKCIREGLVAVLGSKSGKGGDGGEQIKVVQQIPHPNYNKDTRLNDVAVMKLETPSKAKPIALAATDGSLTAVGMNVTVRGWGKTNGRKWPNKLMEVTLEIVPTEVCNKSYSSGAPPETICAGKGDGKDTCVGDDGDGLISGDVLVGVASFGSVWCGRVPGGYTRITSVLSFINEHIKA